MHYAIRLENQEGPYSKKVLAFPESKTRGQRKNWFVYVIVQVRFLSSEINVQELVRTQLPHKHEAWIRYSEIQVERQ